MPLLVLRPLGRIDFDAVQLAPALELGTEHARGFEARVLWRLNQEHRDAYPGDGGLEPGAQIGVARPAERGGRNGHGSAVAGVSLGAEQRLDASVGASG